MRRRTFLALSSIVCAVPSWAAPETFDVIIIGSGAAGLSAAASAAQNGAKKVLVLEKGATLGGHSILSTGYVSAVDPRRQSLQNIKDSPELMLENMLEVGGHKNNIALARIVCNESESIIEWLEKIGVRWENRVVQTVAGLYPRSHITNSVRAGYDYVMALNRYVRKNGVEIRLNTKAEKLLLDGDEVYGVQVSNSKGESQDLLSKAVVIATGGFTANVPLRTHYDPRLTAEFTTTANPSGKSFDGATGDGLLMATALGAGVVDAQYLQLIPFWGGRLLDYVGGDIFVNNQGKRFVSESASWRDISNAILNQPNREMWAITDSKSRKGASLGVKLLNQVVLKCDSVPEMAEKMNIPAATLEDTLKRYNEYVEQENDREFNKNMMIQTISHPPYYFGKEKLYVHFCCGGIKFNENGSVVKTDGTIIKRLYAAGECTGGVHGYDRMGGVAMTTAFVFGRITGKNAALGIF